MIQILGLRPKANGEIEDYSFFRKYKLEADNLNTLFENLDDFLVKIPEPERWNLFLTVADCKGGKRQFESQDVIVFDIDKGVDVEAYPRYLAALCSALGVPSHAVVVISSGNGLHFYIRLHTPIVDKNYFSENRVHYKAICALLNRTLAEAGLPGELDASVFDPRRIMRLPGTINRKEGKPERPCRLLQGKLTPVAFDILLASGIPTVKKDEAVSPALMKRFKKVDNGAILTGCEFLKHAQENANSISEPEWYAALSITTRMENGREVSHMLSKGHRGYRFEETERKIEQALKASPPRKCTSIDSLWSKCSTCPNFQKVESPISLRSADSIGTEDSGFHDVSVNPTNGAVKLKPNFEDLRRFFDRKHIYRTHDKMIWIYTGTHFKEMTNEEVMNFAQTHFDPYATGAMRREFLELVQVTNLVDRDSWNGDTFGKINLRNGVLDIQSGELSPHSPDYGFKYVLPYDYDPTATAPRFEQFLDEVTMGRGPLKDTLLEYGGYALSGASCKFQKALVLDGEGRNGKSTFIDTLKAVAGNLSYSTLSWRELENMERRSALDGVLFNITEETPGRIMDTTTFKNLVSGGSLMMRKLYKNGYSIQNKAKLIFSCNELPASTDSSRGFYRRLLIVPFDFKIDQRTVDLSIQDKLMLELPGILNLMLEGYKRLLRQNHFTKNDDLVEDEQMAEYREATDPVLAWFKERVVLADPEGASYATATDLFVDFDQWAQKSGFKLHGRNAISLGIQLKRYLPDYLRRAHKKRVDGRVIRVLQGVTMKGGDY